MTRPTLASRTSRHRNPSPRAISPIAHQESPGLVSYTSGSLALVDIDGSVTVVGSGNRTTTPDDPSTGLSVTPTAGPAVAAGAIGVSDPAPATRLTGIAI